MANKWSQGLFGCLLDTRICLFAFCLPCVQTGYNAEYFGENCALIGALSCILGMSYGPIIRHRLRQQRDIRGSMVLDVLHYVVVPCCSIAQEAYEIRSARAETVGAGANANQAYEYESNPQAMARA